MQQSTIPTDDLNLEGISPLALSRLAKAIESRMYYDQALENRLTRREISAASRHSTPLFVYGTLMLPKDVRNVTRVPLLCEELAAQMAPALIRGFARCKIVNSDHPAIVRAEKLREWQKDKVAATEKVESGPYREPRAAREASRIDIPREFETSRASGKPTQANSCEQTECEMPVVEGMLIFGLDDEALDRLDMSDGISYWKERILVESVVQKDPSDDDYIRAVERMHGHMPREAVPLETVKLVAQTFVWNWDMSWLVDPADGEPWCLEEVLLKTSERILKC